jgi:hypothetical protein
VCVLVGLSRWSNASMARASGSVPLSMPSRVSRRTTRGSSKARWAWPRKRWAWGYSVFIVPMSNPQTSKRWPQPGLKQVFIVLVSSLVIGKFISFSGIANAVKSGIGKVATFAKNNLELVVAGRKALGIGVESVNVLECRIHKRLSDGRIVGCNMFLLLCRVAASPSAGEVCLLGSREMPLC